MMCYIVPNCALLDCSVLYCIVLYSYHLDQDAEGPLSEEKYAINRSDLPSYYGRIRRFHPDELLSISGFPKGFIWPHATQLSLEKCCGVVGNSVNVAVVKCVMQALFGVELTLPRENVEVAIEVAGSSAF